MKVYNAPVPKPTFDYAEPGMYDPQSPKYHSTVLTNWRNQIRAQLIENGYTGKYTGKIIKFGVADGYAQYMIAQRGNSMSLIDVSGEYQYPDVELYTAKRIKELADRADRIRKVFGHSG